MAHGPVAQDDMKSAVSCVRVRFNAVRHQSPAEIAKNSAQRRRESRRQHGESHMPTDFGPILFNKAEPERRDSASVLKHMVWIGLRRCGVGVVKKKRGFYLCRLLKTHETAAMSYS